MAVGRWSSRTCPYQLGELRSDREGSMLPYFFPLNHLTHFAARDDSWNSLRQGSGKQSKARFNHLRLRNIHPWRGLRRIVNGWRSALELDVVLLPRHYVGLTEFEQKPIRRAKEGVSGWWEVLLGLVRQLFTVQVTHVPRPLLHRLCQLDIQDYLAHHDKVLWLSVKAGRGVCQYGKHVLHGIHQLRDSDPACLFLVAP